jgi:hypothetical protein
MSILILLALTACTPLEPIDSDSASGSEADVDTEPADTGDTEGTEDPDTDDPDCSDDAGEPDDSPEDASDTPLPASLSGVICRNDPDFYAILGERRCELTADLAFPLDGGNIDLILYRDGVGIASSVSSSGTEQLVWTADETDTWVIGVEGRTNAENTYTLAVSANCGAVCVDDNREEDDTQDTAGVLIDQLDVTARICEGDEDWFQVNSGSGCLVQYVATPVAPASLAMSAVDADGLGFDATPTSTQTAVRVIANGPTWLRATGEVDGNYGLSGSSSVCSSVARTCPGDDPFEPNNSRSQAQQTMWNGMFGAATCNDNDWYQFSEAEGCTATVNATFSHSSGDIDIELTDRNGLAIATGETGTNNESVSAVLGAGAAYVRVFGYDGATNGYRLSTTLSCP